MTFSKTPPTVPGDYRWRYNSNHCHELVTIAKDDDGRMIDSNGDYLGALGGEWSPRLVPADEVEKALMEGIKIGQNTVFPEDIQNSRARRVVEGIEQ